MRWEDCLRENKVEKRKIDKELAKSQVKIARERFEFFKSIELSESTARFIMEGYYEAI